MDAVSQKSVGLSVDYLRYKSIERKCDVTAKEMNCDSTK